MARARDIANIINSGTYLTPASASATYATKDENALVYITSSEFSAATSHPVNNIFTETYDNYKLIVNWNSSTGLNLNLKLRNSGEDSNSNYWIGATGRRSSDLAQSFGQQSENVGFRIGMSADARNHHLSIFDLIGPKLNISSTIAGSFVNTSQVDGFHIAGAHLNTGSFNSINLIPSAGNVTGKITIYGYRK